MFNLNRFDIWGLYVFISQKPQHFSYVQHIFTPVYLLQSAKMFTWKMLEFFIVQKYAKNSFFVCFLVQSFKILHLFCYKVTKAVDLSL